MRIRHSPGHLFSWRSVIRLKLFKIDLISKVITPLELHGNLGLTVISGRLDVVQALFVEALMTFVLVLIVCAVCDSVRKDIKGSAPLAIGLAITACHLMAVRFWSNRLYMVENL